MTSHRRWAFGWLAVAMLGAAFSTWAQDADSKDASENEKDVGLGTIVVQVEGWLSQPSGMQEDVATVANVSDPYETTVMQFRQGQESRFRYRVGYELRNDIGDVVLTYLSYRNEGAFRDLRAGSFVFGELLTAPFDQGAFGDGLADGVVTSGVVALRDLRLDFYRKAFENKKVSAKWFVGWRRVHHRRAVGASYYALAPNLDPLIPPVVEDPRDDLNPRPDVASLGSNFGGRGPEAGFEVVLPLKGRRFRLDAGLAVAALRGEVDSDYRSETPFYAIVENDVQQLAAQVGLKTRSIPQSGQVTEVHVGLGFKVWRTLEAGVGFRSIRYDSVGSDIRPTVVTPDLNAPIDSFTPDGLGIVRLIPSGIERTTRSVDYEGLYFGLTYRY